jgi:hypothetical protein
MVSEEELTAIAGKFDLARVAKALEQPPRTDFARKVETFRPLKKGMPVAEAFDWAGHADADVGSGIHVLEYKLPDGSRVLLGTADMKTLMYVKHEKDGKAEDLDKR